MDKPRRIGSPKAARKGAFPETNPLQGFRELPVEHAEEEHCGSLSGWPVSGPSTIYADAA